MMTLILMAHPVMAVPVTAASAVVRGFQQTLLSTMREAASLGYPGRYRRLASAVRASHDLALAARVVTGRYWHRLDGQERQLFITTFEELAISTYANRFDGYSGESFRITAEVDRPRGHRLVRTLLIKGNGGEIHLDYLMRYSASSGWRIVNIISNGVSDLALKRSEYASVMRKQGFDALISMLREKVHRNGLH